MVASRTTPAAIDITHLDDPLADALRTAARGDQPVQVIESGRPLAEITPLHPSTDPPTPGPFGHDRSEVQRVIARRNRLREQIAELDVPPFSAVDWVHDARRDD